jgi:hypothetical protein
MNALALTSHATARMGQRGMTSKDTELIVLIGTRVQDGYFVRRSDYQLVEHELKRFLQHCRRLIGKRLVVQDNRIVTAYTPGKKYERRLMKKLREESD